MACNSAPNNSALSYRRIRVPQEHRATLHLPDAANWRALWNSNCKLTYSADGFKYCEVAEFRSNGRAQIVSAAIEFTSKYREVNFSDRDPSKVVMAGHQPTLFHPGVWYKNFVLGQIGNQTGAIAINLIVDNDVCVTASALIPETVGNSDQYVAARLSYDQNARVLPFEARVIQNQATFSSFGNLGCKRASEFANSPILKHLWPHVRSLSDDGNLGLAIARGRHKLEEELGLQTVELPISLLANTPSFTIFAREILFRIAEFQDAYNNTAAEYRRLNKIRNHAHPVPDLGRDDDWFETPFWIWTKAMPARRSLFAKVENEQLVLSDRDEFERAISFECDDQTFHSEFTTEVCIRPKALITTLFARLIASDLFIHGIGGSKYDQLTDEICRRFFGIRLPDYYTVSATFLIQQQIAPISLATIGKLKDQVRQLKFHPELFIPESAEPANQLVAAKMNWIKKVLPVGNRLSRHQGIINCNEQLQQFVAETRAELETKLQQLQSQFETARILNSREFSFCFYDESLSEMLIELAATNFQ